MTQAASTTPQSEPVLFESSGGLLKGRRMAFGRFELTPTRIKYYQRSSLFLMFGALGALLQRASGGKLALEVEFAKIASVAHGKYALNKKILDFTMIDGAQYRLVIEKFDQFVEAFTKATGRTIAPLP